MSEFQLEHFDLSDVCSHVPDVVSWKMKGFLSCCPLGISWGKQGHSKKMTEYKVLASREVQILFFTNVTTPHEFCSIDKNSLKPLTPYNQG